MKRVKNWQRYLAAFMAAMMMFSCLNVTAFAATGSESQDGNANEVTVTVAELVATRFEDEIAQNVVKSAAINNGGTLTNVKPTNDLVEVTLDGNVCTVTADAYSADGGDGEWVPVSVEIKDTTAGEGADPLLKGDFEDGKFVGAFTAVPASYVAVVTYEWQVKLDADEEARLLALPAQLAAARATMDGVAALYGEEGQLDELNETLEMVIGSLDIAAGFDPDIAERKVDFESYHAPIEKLVNYINDYSVYAEFVTGYPWDVDADAEKLNGEVMQGAVAAARAQVVTLTNKLESSPEYAEIFMSVSDLDVNDLKMLSESLADYEGADKWTFLSYVPDFESDVSADAQAALDANVKALADMNFSTIPDELDYYKGDEVEVNKTTNTVTVNVKVTSYEAGEADLNEVMAGAPVNLVNERDDYTATLHLGAKGLTKEDVEAKVDSKVTEAMAGWWDNYQGNYYAVDYQVPNLTGANQTIAIAVECKPVDVYVTLEGVTKAVPYGAVINLSKYDDVANEGLGYYYTVNDTMLYQGNAVTANKALTITRVKEQALNSYPVMDILVEQYGDALSDAMKDVLASTAVTTGLDESNTVQYRVPSSKLSLVTYDEETDTYKATARKDILVGMTEADGYWQPYALELYGDNDSEPLASVAFGSDEDNAGAFTVQDNVISWEGTAYPEMKKAKVIFSHEVAEESVAENVLGIPGELKAYVDEQSGYLEKAKAIYDGVAENSDLLTKGTLTLLKNTYLETSEGKAAVDAIVNGETNEEGETVNPGWVLNNESIALFDYLGKAAEDWNLGAILKNGEGDSGLYGSIMGELTKTVYGRGLGEYLYDIANDPGFLKALKNPQFNVPEPEAKVNKILEQQEKLGELKEIEGWQMPSTLNKDSSDFVAMIEKIKNTNAVQLNAPTVVGPITAYASVTQAANGFYTMNYVVEVETADGKGGTYYITKEFDPAKIYEADEVIAQEEIDEQIMELEKGIFGENNANRQYYEDAASFGSDNFVSGEAIKANEEYVKTYKLKKFTVSVEGGKTYSAHLGYTPTVELPADSADSDTYYKYYIDGEMIGESGENYIFTAEDMLAFPEGGLKITREAGSREADAMNEFVAKMNEALDGLTAGGEPMMQFEALKADANSTKAYDSLILKLNTSAEMGTEELTSVLSESLLFLMNYDTIAFGSEALMAEGVLYPQTLVNLMLNGDISSDTLLSKINEDGTVKSDKVGETSVGAQLVKSTIYLDDYTYEFYVTLGGGDTELLKSLRSLLSKAEGYVDFALADGTVSLNATIPESVYKLYASLLVVLDFVELEDLEDANVIGDIAARLEEVLVKANPDAEMLQDALNKAGVELDLMSYEAIVNKMINGVKSLLGKVARDESASGIYDYTFTYDMSAMIGEMDLGDLDPAKLFGEGGMVLTLPCEFVVTNGTAFPYEALVLDITAESVTNKVDYVKDLQAALTNAAGPVYAVLLKDLGTVDEPVTLKVNKDVVLDLNGKIITGTVDATNGNLRIVSRILSGDVGGVTGELKGTVSVANGKYLKADGTVMTVSLPTGYQQDAETGAVSNIYYSIAESGNTTTITVEPSQILDSENLTKRQPLVLVLEMLSDVMMNLDVYAGVSFVDVDGEEKVIYNVGQLDVLDLVKDASNKDLGAISDTLFGMVSKDDLKSVLESVLSDMTDTAGISDALENGGKLASYTMKVYPWLITPSVSGDELNVTIGAGKEKTKTIEIVVGEDILTEDELADLKALYSAAKDIVSVKNEGFNLGTITYTDGKLGWSGSIDATVTFDLTNDDGSASDYVTALAAILANSADNKDAYNRAIRLYHSNEHATELESIFNGLTVGALMDAVADCDTMSFEQLIAATGLAGEVEDVESLADYYDVVLYFASNMASAVRSIVNEADDTKYADTIDAFREKSVAGLYNGETFAYGESELTVVMNLFNQKYVSSVTAVTADIKALLDVEITEGMSAEDLLNAAEQLAKINETLQSMSDDAKAMVADEMGYESVNELMAALVGIYEELMGAGLLNVMIAEITKLPVLDLGAADIIPNYDTVNALVDQLYAIYTYVLSDEDRDGIANADKLLNAVEYFDDWNTLFDTLKGYIDNIKSMDVKDMDSMENTSLAYEIYLTLGNRAKEYFEDMHPGLLAKLEAAVAVFDRARDLWITEIEPVTYNGTAQKPAIRVYEGLKLLAEKVDYTISYKNNTKAYAFDEKNANYAAYVEAHNDVKDAEKDVVEKQVPVDEINSKIAAKNDEIKATNDRTEKAKLNAELKVLKDELKEPQAKLKEAQSNLKKAQSKETTAANKVPAVVVNFKKNYTGTAYRYFEILPIDLNKIEPTSATYEEGYAESVKLEAQDETSAVVGAAAKATAPTITLNGKKVSTSEYTLKLQKYVAGVNGEQGNWTDVDTKVEKKFVADTEYRVAVEGKGTNFVGTYYVEQVMAAYMMSKATIGKIAAQDYADWATTANVFADDERYRDEDGDAVVVPNLSYWKNYGGDDQELIKESQIVVTFKSGKTTVELIEDDHYTVSYESNKGAGTAKVIITGTGDSAKAITGYDGNGNPEYTEQTYSFSGTKTATFKINGIKLASNMVTFAEKTITKDYTGEALTLDADEYAVSYKAKNAAPVDLVEGEHYTVSYDKNVNKGTASVIFTGKGIYTGTVKKTFKIAAADLSLADAEIAGSAVYSKSGAMPTVELNYNGMDLKEKTDYTVTYKNNKKVFAFNAEENALYKAYLAAEKAVKEAQDALDKRADDSNLKKLQSNLKNAESKLKSAKSKLPLVTIKGKGNYAGTIEQTFVVEPASFEAVEGVAKDVKWNPNKNGVATVKTTVTLTDADGKKLSASDYEKTTEFLYEYLNKAGAWTPLVNEDGTPVKTIQIEAGNTNVDEAGYVTMRVTVDANPTGSYEGSKTIVFNLYTKDLSKAKVDRDSKYQFVYDRDEKEFVGIIDGDAAEENIKLTYTEKVNGVNVTTTLVEGEDYKLEYVGHKFAGTATATLTGMNEFGGTKKITFKIQKNSAEVEKWDDRIHFFGNEEAETTMLFATQYTTFEVYNATVLFEF